MRTLRARDSGTAALLAAIGRLRPLTVLQRIGLACVVCGATDDLAPPYDGTVLTVCEDSDRCIARRIEQLAERYS